MPSAFGTRLPDTKYREGPRIRRQFLGAFAKLRKATISFHMSVRPSVRPSVCPSVRPSARPPAWNSSTPTGRIFMKLGFFIFENLSRKLKFYQNPTRITDTLHENVFTFMTIYR